MIHFTVPIATTSTRRLQKGTPRQLDQLIVINLHSLILSFSLIIIRDCIADLVVLQSISYIAGALGVFVAAISYMVNLRISQRNQELMLKSQNTFVMVLLETQIPPTTLRQTLQKGTLPSMASVNL